MNNDTRPPSVADSLPHLRKNVKVDEKRETAEDRIHRTLHPSREDRDRQNRRKAFTYLKIFGV